LKKNVGIVVLCKFIIKKSEELVKKSQTGRPIPLSNRKITVSFLGRSNSALYHVKFFWGKIIRF
jgi:hypothetical protein